MKPTLPSPSNFAAHTTNDFFEHTSIPAYLLIEMALYENLLGKLYFMKIFMGAYGKNVRSDSLHHDVAVHEMARMWYFYSFRTSLDIFLLKNISMLTVNFKNFALRAMPSRLRNSKVCSKISALRAECCLSLFRLRNSKVCSNSRNPCGAYDE